MKPKMITRPSELVLSAIYNLDRMNGSSPDEIVNYISNNFGVNTNEIKQKVEAALKRGISFGLISHGSGGLYKLAEVKDFQSSRTTQGARRRKKEKLKPDDLESSQRSDSNKKKHSASGKCKCLKAKVREGNRRPKKPRTKLAVIKSRTPPLKRNLNDN